eukprot:comp23091_c0_seq1/m.37087 comp23091_c0_seq1/g.37087  ORF comp23091_c0_seq1/g.37087 comp23091_c0_seq1/m.37087 type:complete len:400 (-) comp23091_c0_seq1:481-1680(-)
MHHHTIFSHHLYINMSTGAAECLAPHFYGGYHPSTLLTTTTIHTPSTKTEYELSIHQKAAKSLSKKLFKSKARNSLSRLSSPPSNQTSYTSTRDAHTTQKVPGTEVNPQKSAIQTPTLHGYPAMGGMHFGSPITSFSAPVMNEDTNFHASMSDFVNGTVPEFPDFTTAANTPPGTNNVSLGTTPDFSFSPLPPVDFQPQHSNDVLKNEATGENNGEQTGDELGGELSHGDKRKRNCVASARFRQKKKQEMQMLEEIATRKTEECEKLTQEVKMLQNEIHYLKQFMHLSAVSGGNNVNTAMLQNQTMAAQMAAYMAAMAQPQFNAPAPAPTASNDAQNLLLATLAASTFSIGLTSTASTFAAPAPLPPVSSGSSLGDVSSMGSMFAGMNGYGYMPTGYPN